MSQSRIQATTFEICLNSLAPTCREIGISCGCCIVCNNIRVANGNCHAQASEGRGRDGQEQLKTAARARAGPRYISETRSRNRASFNSVSGVGPETLLVARQFDAYTERREKVYWTLNFLFRSSCEVFPLATQNLRTRSVFFFFRESL